MSTSRVINRWLNRVYKSIAIFLVLFAVLISGFRLFLPYVHHYREHVQNFINSTNDSQITIGELSMDWEKLGPSIVIKQVSLLETQSTDIFIDKIHVHLDFWQSLAKGRLITQDVTLDGAQVFIKNFKTSTKSKDKDAPLVARIADIFLDRIGRFSLLNSQIVFQTNQTEKLLLINQLDWLNEGDSHRGKGYVIVDGLTSNNIKVILDLHGDEIEELDGQVYLQANQLNITPWLDTIFAIDNKDTHSAINFDGWLTIDGGFPTELQVSLGNNEISWIHNKQHKFFSVNQGQILTRFTKEQDNKGLKAFNIVSSPLTFITNKKSWQPTQLQFSKDSGILNGYISDLSIEGISDIAPLFSNDKNITQLLDQTNPVGVIKDIFLQVSKNNQAVVAGIKGVTSHPYIGIPGVSNIDGELVFKNNVAQLSLQSENGALDFAEHFIKPIPYRIFSSDFMLNFDEGAWGLSSDNIEFSSDELTLSAAISIDKPKDEDTKMSLLASILNGKAELANHYFPNILMGDDLVNYLNGAIVSGKIEQAQVLFNGPLNKFPFNNHEGIFNVDAELSEAEFKFDPHWPAIQNFNANLTFNNNSMLITGRNGDLDGIDVKGVTAEIKDLSHEQILKVKAAFNKTNPGLVTRLMNKSPMKKTVGNTLNQLVISKPISGKFSLDLPLNKPEDAVAKGTVNFKNNSINLQTPNMLFTQVNGQLAYNNDQINADNVTLLWRGMPLNLSVNAKDKAMLYNTNINLEANWKSKDWLKQLPEVLQEYGSGSLAWQGLLSLNMYHEGGFTYDLGINSTLDKTELKLPAPYTKKAGEVLALKTHVTGQTYNTTINASVGEQLQFYGVLNHDNISFSKAHLVLGSEEMLLPTKGFHITTKLAQADVEQWQPFIFNIIESINTSDDTKLPGNSGSLVNDNTTPKKPPLLDKPERIRGEIDSLLYGDYSLSDMSFNLGSNDTSWLLDINSKEARTKVIFHNNIVEKGIQVEADFIHLAKIITEGSDDNLDASTSSFTSEGTPQAEQQDANLFNQKVYAQLPPLMVQCGSCIIDNIDLGKVSFAIERNSENQILLNKFEASRDKFAIELNGTWSQKDGIDTSSFTGFIDTKDLEQETEKLGYTPTIKDSGLRSEFAFNWPASPYEFDVAKLNGQFNAKLDDGYLAEVPDQARVFSVLSLQSLVRKLSFDFRDIFSDGMFYSSISGDFQLKDGIMYTDNLFMKGAAGDLEVKGNTDLGKELLDLRMSYKPNVTSSLPALAWIATLNPVAFLAGIALEEVITSKVYYEMNFELTGNMSQPIFKDVNRKTRNISVGKTTPPQIVEDVIVTPASEIQKNNSESSELPKKSEVDG